jgi:hypothetical protein
MKRSLSLFATLAAVTALAVPAAGAGIAERIKLTPRGGSGVSGTALVSSPGDRAAAIVKVTVHGLEPGAFARVQLNTVSGRNTSASTVLIVSARADASGRLAASGRVLYRGQPVTFATIADGAHAVSVLTGGKVVARGIVPGMD